MSQYMHRVNEIAAAEGISVNPMEQASLFILQNEIENIETENEAKENILRALGERLETIQAELKAEKELNQPDKLSNDIIADLDTITSKNNVLMSYMGVMEHGDEFRVNKLVKDVGEKLERYHRGGKQLIDKARALNADLAGLRDLKKKLEDLKKNDEI